MRRDAINAYKGRTLITPAAGYVREYLQRKILSKIGITEDINGVDDFKVECFTIIASEFASQEEKEIKKSRKK